MIETGLPARDLVRLRDLADSLAREWVVRARARSTAGGERANLRLFGVDGLDRDGRPLAAEVVDRYLAGGANRLAHGIALPFAIALLEYDIAPQRLALDVASGAVDLGLEAALLAAPDRRAAAEHTVARLVAAALERVDANRTARRELLDVIGDAPRPWIGTSAIEPAAYEAAAEARALARAGADLIRVEVPAGRELVRRLGERGVELPRWSPPAGSARGAEDASRSAVLEDAPAGSQRGLAHLRDALDAAAAARGGYVRLLAAPPTLNGPEAAVVAAFERVDFVEADPVAEIVIAGVDPDRAIADHVAAARIHRRAGTTILLGAGPLAVAPELAAGQPADPAVRTGRALALALSGAAIAREAGLAPDAIVVGALPAWLSGETDPAARAAAEVALRAELLPGHPFAFVEPSEPADGARAAAWPFIVASLLPPAPVGTLVLRRRTEAPFAGVAETTSAALAVAAALDGSTTVRVLTGLAADHARAAALAARETLERLAADGWDWLVGGPAEGRGGGLGHDAVADREPDGELVDRALEDQGSAT